MVLPGGAQRQFRNELPFFVVVGSLHEICLLKDSMIKSMRSENVKLRSRYDGLDVSVLVTVPETEQVAVLQVAHGMRGCKERFLPFMKFMAEHGVVCIANDHRGHGESVKALSDRGYMYSGGYVALVEDMKMVTDWAHERFPDLPVYLLGHSMGSLAARTYMKNHDDAVSGLFVCGSPSQPPMASVMLALVRMLCVFGNGRMRLPVVQDMTSWMYNRRFSKEGRNAWTCSDPSVRRDFLANPSCSFDFTVNATYALMSMMHETYSRSGWNVANPDLPVYFVSGDADPCMRGEAAFHAAAQHMADIGYRNVTSALYAGMRHEILNEIGKETVWEDILSHISGKK